MSEVGAGKGPIVPWLVALAVTLVVSGVGLAGLLFLMLALNGLSERQALPWVGGYVLLVSAANAALVAFATWLVVRRRPGPQVTFVVLTACAFTLLPYLCAAGAWLVAVGRTRG